MIQHDFTEEILKGQLRFRERIMIIITIESSWIPTQVMNCVIISLFSQ